jgi:hypothetical protein
MTEGGIKQPGGTANITLTVAEIKDVAVTHDTDITVSRSGNNNSFTVELAAGTAYDPSTIKWLIRIGNDFETLGANETFTLNITEQRYIMLGLGGHSLILEIDIDGILYRKNIFFRIIL